MKTFFLNGIPLIALAGLLLLLPMGWVQAGTGTTRVSVDSAGNQANGYSYDPSISADGRFVAFHSFAPNLVAGDTNAQWDIFVHDRQSGTTTRVSVDSAGGQADSGSYGPSISADGRFVAFASLASNLVANDTNGQYDIFVHDRQTGTTTGVDSTGRASGSSSISADGRFVAFVSVASGGTNSQQNVFVHDRQTGTTNVVIGGGGTSYVPSISADGRFVAFANGQRGMFDIFVHDRQSSATVRVSVDSAGRQANHTSYAPSISADGRFVAFASLASNLMANDTNGQYDIFVHDRQTGTTTPVSVDSTGGQANSGSYASSISADGRFVAFASVASNLVAGDTNGQLDIFVHDRQSATTTRVSSGFGFLSLSADGRFVAFELSTDNLVAGGTNGAVDIFVHQIPCGPDTDCDGIPDTQDNCLSLPNGPAALDAGGHSQRDTNGDGFGNVCDADLNNDGLVTAADYLILRRRLNTADPDADLDGNGLVTLTDYRILRGLLNKAPGPSGLVP